MAVFNVWKLNFLEEVQLPQMDMNIYSLLETLFTRGLWIIQLGVLLLFLWQVDVRRRLNEKWLLGGIALLTALYIAKALWQTVPLYFTWKSGPLSQFFLPPHQPITYFLSYTEFRFWRHFEFALFFAILFFAVIGIVRRTNPRFFYKGEEYLAALSILLLGWPRIILYIPLMLALLLLTSAWTTFSRSSRYTPFIYVWLPAALLVLLFGNQIIVRLGLGHLFIAGPAP